MGRVFAAALDGPSPTEPLLARELGDRLLPAASEAMRLAARSSHTHLRRASASLAEESHTLACAARRVGLLDPDHFARRLEAVRAACASAPDDAWTSDALQAARAASDALVSTPVEVNQAGLSALATAADALEEREDALLGVETGAAEEALDAVADARRALQQDLTEAARGLKDAAGLPERWGGFRAAILREVEAP